MDRRDFIRKLGISAAAASVLSPGFVFADEKERAATKKTYTYPDLSADVVVVGAGPSGIPAAIAAARAGARVILLEQDAMPGGAPVNMYISMLCGGPRVGIYREMARTLNSEFTVTGTPRPDFGPDGANGKNHWYLPSSFMLVNTRLIAAEKNIELMCGARVTDVIVDTKGGVNRVRGVRIARNGGLQNIYAPVTIDATGTGEIGALSGALVMYGRDGQAAFGEDIGAELPDDKVQRCTWMYISERMRPDAVLPWDKLKSRGMVEDDLNVWVRAEHVGRKAGIYLHWGATTVCEDTRDPVAIAEAQQKCLETLLPDAQTLLEAGFLMHLAPKLGIRETRRIKGEYVLTTNDMKAGNYPEDTIAYTSYGLDPWGENIPKDKRHTKPHGIPYRCLLPLGVDGLLMAGKSISGSHLAASGYRVQPIVASIGQAAGTAAAMAVAEACPVRDVDIRKLRSSLTDQGLFIQKQE